MAEHPLKQMLYLTLHERGGNGYIAYELEPYYSRSSRHIFTTKKLNICDPKLLLRDDLLKESLGFSLIAALFTYCRDDPDPDNRVWSQIVYPHFKGNDTVLRIDFEPARYKPVRQKFCGELLLPSLDYDTLLDDESFKRTLAEHVLRYLPISEELCLMHDELKADHG